jgi:hypothetical protein
MHDELASMSKNKVWDLMELPVGCKAVGCKWVFKTKRDPSGKIKRYKARLVAKLKAIVKEKELITRRPSHPYLRRILFGLLWLWLHILI